MRAEYVIHTEQLWRQRSLFCLFGAAYLRQSEHSGVACAMRRILAALVPALSRLTWVGRKADRKTAPPREERGRVRVYHPEEMPGPTPVEAEVQSTGCTQVCPEGLPVARPRVGNQCVPYPDNPAPHGVDRPATTAGRNRSLGTTPATRRTLLLRSPPEVTAGAEKPHRPHVRRSRSRDPCTAS